MSASSTTDSFNFKRFFKFLNCKQLAWILSINLSLCCLDDLSSQQITTTNQAPNNIVAGPFTLGALDELLVIEGLPTNAIVKMYRRNTVSGNFEVIQDIFFLGSGNYAHIASGYFHDPQFIDFVVQLNSPSRLYVFRNNGGIFTFNTILSPPKAPNYVATGRLKVMGVLDDIVVVCAGSNSADPSFTVYFNNDGNFSDTPPHKVTVPLSAPPSSVATGDIDGDGLDEIVVTYFTANQIEIFKNNGSNQFTSIGKTTVGQNPSAVALGTLQGQNPITNVQKDIVVTNLMDKTVSVLLNNLNNSGTFKPIVNYAVQDAPTSLVITDLNHNDAFNDIAVANQSQSTVSLLINNGSGTFSPAVNQNANSGPFSITAGRLLDISSISLGVANPTGGYFSTFKPSTAP
jgi:hypothetical protein